jgi:hypothetical protein
VLEGDGRVGHDEDDDQQGEHETTSRKRLLPQPRYLIVAAGVADGVTGNRCRSVTF